MNNFKFNMPDVLVNNRMKKLQDVDQLEAPEMLQDVPEQSMGDAAMERGGDFLGGDGGLDVKDASGNVDFSRDAVSPDMASKMGIQGGLSKIAKSAKGLTGALDLSDMIPKNKIDTSFERSPEMEARRKALQDIYSQRPDLGNFKY